MHRVIDPPPERLSGLPAPMTAGRRQVLELFQQRLSGSWEIYVQPHLNGLHPDFVLLNPGVGIGVFKVREWDLDRQQYWVRSDGVGLLPRLMRRDADGVSRSLEHENPVRKVRRIKYDIYQTYCPGLREQEGGYRLITAGVILTRTSSSRSFGVLDGLRTDQERLYPKLNPFSGWEDVVTGDIDRVFPGCRAPRNDWMTRAGEAVLRDWLRSPVPGPRDGPALVLDQRQRALATTRHDGRFRRVRGPAGSGKTAALAARAAELADRGNRVLFLCPNIIFIKHFRNIIARHRTGREPVRRQVEVLNARQWCRRVCEEAGREADMSQGPASRGRDDPLLRLVREAYEGGDDTPGAPRYDAILVDQVQDLAPPILRTLRMALRPGGEMMLAMDRTQDIYGQVQNWTEKQMGLAGFGGPWFDLETVYRLPQAITPVLRRYASEFLADWEADLPARTAVSRPVVLRWVQMEASAGAVEVCRQEALRQMEGLSADAMRPVVLYVTGEEKTGQAFARELEQLGASQGSPKLRVRPVLAFGGQEAPRLLVYVDSVSGPREAEILYTAFTRLKQVRRGNALTVVSACLRLQEFGRTWPDYQEVARSGRYRSGFERWLRN